MLTKTKYFDIVTRSISIFQLSITEARYIEGLKKRFVGLVENCVLKVMLVYI